MIAVVHRSLPASPLRRYVAGRADPRRIDYVNDFNDEKIDVDFLRTCVLVTKGRIAPLRACKIAENSVLIEVAMPEPEIPITDDTPLRLKDAARIAFPEGSGITAATLRAQAKRGNLRIEVICNKHFTTLAAIAEMRMKCVRREPGSISDSRPGRSAVNGLSAQDALNRTLEKLKNGSLKKPYR